MEFEALLLGLEPLTALAIGVGTVIISPVVDAVSKATGQDSKLSESVSQSAREFAKNTIIFGLEAFETAQTTVAEAEESFRDLVADAKTERTLKKSEAEKVTPREVEIVSE